MITIWMMLLMVLFLSVGFLFWLWALLDCAAKEPPNHHAKFWWIVFILIANVPGAAIYFLIRRPERIQQLGR